jgi:hypothetical protein
LQGKKTLQLATCFLVAAAVIGHASVPKRVEGVKPCPGLKGARVFTENGRAAVEVQVKMDVDVDGAPNAYGPRGKKALDNESHARAPHSREIVGYMTEYPGGPPTVQRKDDPYPGYYVSQTSFFDTSIRRKEDPRRYVDATKINYVVLGRAARRAGVQLGDFAVVYSCRTGRSVFAIVGDDGNESGAEGSLALVQALGYDIRDGIEESVGDREIVIRYYPHSNSRKQFFTTQSGLDEAAYALGLRK